MWEGMIICLKCWFYIIWENKSRISALSGFALHFPRKWMNRTRHWWLKQNEKVKLHIFSWIKDSLRFMVHFRSCDISKLNFRILSIILNRIAVTSVSANRPISALTWNDMHRRTSNCSTNLEWNLLQRRHVVLLFSNYLMLMNYSVISWTRSVYKYNSLCTDFNHAFYISFNVFLLRIN